MNRLLLTFSLCTILPAYLICQNVSPARPFGDDKLVHDFICSEVVYPEHSLKMGVEGTVVLGFIVEKDGSISNLHVVGSVNPELDAEALRLFRMLLWEPATRLGYPVASEQKFSFPFNIRKYTRHCKNRGYEKTEYPFEPIDTSYAVYDKNLLNQSPEPVFDENGMTLGKFISENIVYPDNAYRQNISGKVLLSFIIEPQGRMSNIQVLRPVGGGCTEEAIRVARLIKWKPGIKDGMAVRTKMQLDFTFRLPDDTQHQILDNNQGGAL